MTDGLNLKKETTVGEGSLILSKDVVKQAVQKYLNDEVFGNKVDVKVTNIQERDERPYQTGRDQAVASVNEPVFEVKFSE